MNILHMKYAVEVAKSGSLNKAAESLAMNQPNLSRAIKELENSLGVTLFTRSTKGMVLTPDGETFLRYAKVILKQVDEVENMFRNSSSHKKTFSISVPRASYISNALSSFSLALRNEENVKIFYEETNTQRIIKNILEADYNLGILRYAESFNEFYTNLFKEKGLRNELVTEFKYILLMNKENPLAKKDFITFADLRDYIEIAHADPFVPSLPFASVRKEELPDNINRRIFVFERASQFDLLSTNPDTFMWVTPSPKSTLDRFGLVEKKNTENNRVYRDVIIYKKDYVLSDLDKLFISELCRAKRELF